MDRVTVERYNNPEDIGYTGYVHTPKWILFERLDGTLLFGRRNKTGAVVGDLVTL